MRKLLVLATVLLEGCAPPRAAPPRTVFASLADLCGKAFEGRIVSPPVAADASFAGRRLIIHVRECTKDMIRVPFHVGEDRSRIWVVTRTAAGYRLKHDHRHDDGSEDRLTQYGGDSPVPGNPVREMFPADAFTKQLLVREGNVAGAANVWAIEVHPGRSFAYELRRPNRSSGSSSTSPDRLPRRLPRGERARRYSPLATRPRSAYIALTLLDIVKTLGPGRGRSGSVRPCIRKPD